MSITQKSLMSLSSAGSAMLLLTVLSLLPGARAQDIEPIPEDVLRAAGETQKPAEQKPGTTAVDDLEALFGALGGATDAAAGQDAATPAAEAPGERTEEVRIDDLEALLRSLGAAETKDDEKPDAEDAVVEERPAEPSVEQQALDAVQKRIDADERAEAQAAERTETVVAPGQEQPEVVRRPVVEPEPEEIEADERVRRREYELMAEHHFIQASNAYRKGEFADARREFEAARVKLQRVSKSAPRVLRKQEAIKQALFDLHVDWADALAREARRMANAEKCDEAIEKCHAAAALDPSRRKEMDQRIRKYIELKRETEVRALTAPENVDVGKPERDFDINVLFEQGKVFFDHARYADARDMFEQILLKDPYEVRAIRYLRRISERLSATAEERYRMVVAERMAEVRWKWGEPVTPLLAGPAAQLGAAMVRKTDRETGIRAKLNDIIIPKIEFDELPITEVINTLKQRSMELDPDGEGVNIFLQLEAPAPVGMPAGAPAGPADPFGADPFGGGAGDFGAPGDFGGAGGFGAAAPGAPAGGGFGDFGAGDFGGFGDFQAQDAGFPGAAAPMAVGAPSAARTITMHMDNIPLGEVIRYICMGAGLKFRVESSAVIIADKSVPLDELETRFYAVEAGVLDSTRTRRAAALELRDDGDGGGWSDEGTGEGGEAAAPTGLAYFFAGFGVDFPQGSRISYYQRTGKLVVHNTPENLRKIEKVLEEIGVTPSLVTIEAKFVEVEQTNMETLGFDWYLKGGGVSYHPATPSSGIDHFLSSDVTGKPMVGGAGSEYQFGIGKDLDNITKGVRFGSSAFGGFGFPAGMDEIVSVYSILGDVAFRTVVHALQQRGQADVLSAPKVTTLSGNTAVLRMVTERYFPESWSEPTVTPATESTGGSYTPSIPEFGEARDIGVILEVTPTVAADGYSIDLDLRPQVIDFIAFDESFNYDMVIDGVRVTAMASMPILAARTVETKVIVWDGETVVLGGMIRERLDKFDDKVPLLGDVPLVGRLFRSKGERSVKTNLLIFVTARLVNPAGLPIRAGEIRGMHDFRR